MKGINIMVSRETHQRLIELGKKGESFNDIIEALLDNADTKKECIMMVNDEIEYTEVYFSIEIDVFKDKKEKMNGYVSIPQIQEEEMENESEWYTWTNNGYVNRIEYPSIEFGHKYMEWIDLITEIIFMYEIGDGLTVIQRKDIKIMVSSNEDDL